MASSELTLREVFLAEAIESAHEIEMRELRERIADLEKALEPFVGHGRALGAYTRDCGPFRYYTDAGYREVKADDFRRAKEVLKKGSGE